MKICRLTWIHVLKCWVAACKLMNLCAMYTGIYTRAFQLHEWCLYQIWFIKTNSVNMLLSRRLHTLADSFLCLWRFWEILNENYHTKYCTRIPILFSYSANRRWKFKYLYFPIELWVLNVDVSCVTCSSTTLSLRLVNCRDKALYMEALRKTEHAEIIAFINHLFIS